MKIADQKRKKHHATYDPCIKIKPSKNAVMLFENEYSPAEMIKKYKSHNSHKNKKCDCRKKHPFYQTGKVRTFSFKLLKYYLKVQV